VWCFTTAITEWTAIERVVQLADHLERVLAATEAIMRVKDLRTRAVVTVEPEASVVEARRLMQEKRIRHLPVVDAGRHVLGMVTDRDIRLNLASPAATLSVWELNYLLAKLTVGNVMTRTVIVVEPDRDARGGSASDRGADQGPPRGRERPPGRHRHRDGLPPCPRRGRSGWDLPV
jgi:CBS-domain-containing membrane protein